MRFFPKKFKAKGLYGALFNKHWLRGLMLFKNTCCINPCLMAQLSLLRCGGCRWSRVQPEVDPGWWGLGHDLGEGRVCHLERVRCPVNVQSRVGLRVSRTLGIANHILPVLNKLLN